MFKKQSKLGLKANKDKNSGSGGTKAPAPKIINRQNTKSSSSNQETHLQRYLKKKDSYPEKIDSSISPVLKTALKQLSENIINNKASEEYQKFKRRKELIQKLEIRISKMNEFNRKLEARKEELRQSGLDEIDAYDDYDVEDVLGDEDEIEMEMKDFLDSERKDYYERLGEDLDEVGEITDVMDLEMLKEAIDQKKLFNPLKFLGFKLKEIANVNNVATGCGAGFRRGFMSGGLRFKKI